MIFVPLLSLTAVKGNRSPGLGTAWNLTSLAIRMAQGVGVSPRPGLLELFPRACKVELGRGSQLSRLAIELSGYEAVRAEAKFSTTANLRK